MTANKQNSSFLQARNALLSSIRAGLRGHEHDLAKTSDMFVQDSLTYEISDLTGDNQNDQQKADAAFMRHAAETVVEAIFDNYRGAVDGLLAGRSVYDLLGAHSIPTYHAITGGDQDAGKLSAVEDMTILLMSMTFSDITKQVFEDIKSSRAFSPDLEPTLRYLLDYVSVSTYDTILDDLNDKVLEKLPTPQEIIYENGAIPAAGLLRRQASRFMRGLVHHSTPNMHRARKVPKTWPPLHFAAAAAEGAPHSAARPRPESIPAGAAGAQALQKPEFLSRHDALDARSGYLEVMIRFHRELQERHFGAIEDKKYAALVKLPAMHETRIQDMARDVVSDLRERIRDRITEVGALAGFFRAGAMQASGEIEADIARTALPAAKADPVNDRIIGKLKESWNALRQDILIQIDIEGPRFAPASPSPYPV